LKAISEKTAISLGELDEQPEYIQALCLDGDDLDNCSIRQDQTGT
jgi:hypothetical protein